MKDIFDAFIALVKAVPGIERVNIRVTGSKPWIDIACKTDEHAIAIGQVFGVSLQPSIFEGGDRRYLVGNDHDRKDFSLHISGPIRAYKAPLAPDELTVAAALDQAHAAVAAHVEGAS